MKKYVLLINILPIWLGMSTVQCQHSSMPTQFNANTVQCQHSSMPTQFNANTVQCQHSSMPTQLNGNLGSTCKEPSARPMRLFYSL